MQTFIKHFIRLGPGTWTCVEYGEYRSPKGRIQITPGKILTKGRSYMGLDLAAILEQEFKSQHALNSNKISDKMGKAEGLSS
jgi:hypothetical protein